MLKHIEVMLRKPVSRKNNCYLTSVIMPEHKLDIKYVYVLFPMVEQLGSIALPTTKHNQAINLAEFTNCSSPEAESRNRAWRL